VALKPVIFVCILGILGLFALDWDRRLRTSKALWIPVVWLLIIGSRPVGMWLSAFPPPLETSDRTLVEGSPIDRLVFTCLSAIGLLVLIVRGKKVLALLRANGPIVLFFLYCAVSVVWSDFPEVAFRRWIKALGDLVMVMVVLTDLDPAAAVKRLLARGAFVLLPLSVFLLKYYPNLARVYTHWTFTPLYTGVTTNKNELGMICLIFGLGSVWRFLHSLGDREEPRRMGHLVAHAVLLSMTAWLFWTANSMTSLSCFLMGSGLMVLTRLRFLARKPALMHALIVTLLSLPLFAVFFDSQGSLVGTLGRDPTITGRSEIWAMVLHLSGNPFFGTGFDSFWLGERLNRMWSAIWWHPNEAHNGYLELFLNLGWIGVGVFAVVLVKGYRNVVQAFGRDPHSGRLRMALLAATVAYNLTESAFKQTSPLWLIFLLAIMVVPTAPVQEDSPLALDQPSSFPEGEPEEDRLLPVGLHRGIH